MTSIAKVLLGISALLLIPACDGGDDATIINNYQSSPGGDRCIALSADGSFLLSFSSAAPGTVTFVAIGGVTWASGEIIRGIDYRPATGQLFGMGVDGLGNTRLYSINPSTGLATFVGQQGIVVQGVSMEFGVDFNPTADRLRVVNSANTNYRLNPDTGALSAIDTNLSYTPAATGPIIGVAYANNFVGATVTTLYAIDGGSSRLARIGGVDGTPSPNGGAVTAVGVLGVTVDGGSDAGFDITSTGKAYATLMVGGVTGLYLINLTTGAAIQMGLVGDGSFPISSLTIAP